MNILSVDTSTQILSIALLTENSYEERLVDGNFSPSENLLNEIEELLGRAGIEMKDLDLLAVSKGPGSFTGLRIAMASMKGIASALSIPLVSVPTLDAISASVGIYPGAILSVIDAKKKKFYMSMKKNDETIIEDRDGNAEDVIKTLKKEDMPILITGPDALLFSEKIMEIDDSIPIMTDPYAPRNLSKAIISLGLEKYRTKGADDIGEGPVYIRRSDAEEALEKRMKERERNGV